jgi:ABC-type polysaccharide transport system permease subunit
MGPASMRTLTSNIQVHQNKIKFEENLTGYLFMAPAVWVLGMFVALPILLAFFLAFQKVRLLGGLDFEFVGLRHFSRLAQDERIGIALKNTLEYVSIGALADGISDAVSSNPECWHQRSNAMARALFSADAHIISGTDAYFYVDL